jgi:hypothetical protein
MVEKENILKLWYELNDFIPVNWKNKESINKFKIAHDTCAKLWSRLDQADQGWMSEQILNNIHLEDNNNYE